MGIQTASQAISNEAIGGLSNRNRVINGNFIIAQRATSANANSAAYHTVDRWKTWVTNGYNTQSRQAFTPGDTTVSGNPVYYFRNVVTNDASAGHFNIVTTNLENTGLFAGKPAVLSFWAKADTNRSMTVEFNQNFGTGGSTRVTGTEAPSHLKTFSLTSSWTKYSFPVTLTSISGKTNNVADSFLEIYFWFSTGSSLASRIGGALSGNGGTFDIAQVQFERGSVDTDFEERLIGTELALCQRYYEVVYLNINTSSILSGLLTTNSNWTTWYFKQQKRSVPTVALTSTGSWVNATPNYYPTVTQCDIGGNSTYFYLSGTSGSPAIYASSEL
jgi:hypothetical protein